jgi:D-3-phosphoglycerate dehydrogenase
LKVKSEALEQSRKLMMIVRAGVGSDNIDKEYCNERGIFIADCPLLNANAIAELTIGLILNCDRRIALQNEMLKLGRWDKKLFSTCSKGLNQSVLGLVGYDAVAQNVAKIAKAMGMEILVYQNKPEHET